MARTRQPQSYARINPYWVSRGLVFLFNGATNQDLYSQQLATNNGGVVRRANINGSLGPDISGTQYLSFSDANALDIIGPLTIFWRGVLDATSGADRSMVSKAYNNGSYNTPFDLAYRDSTSQITAVRGGTDFGNYRSSALTTTTPTAGQLLTVAVMYATTDVETVASNAYINSTAQSLSGGGPAYSNNVGANSSPLRIGRREDGNQQLDGSVECVALFNQRLTAVEYLRLYADPWAELIAAPRRLWIQLGAASGGAGADAAIAGTQNSDVGAITAEATTAAAIAGTQDADVGTITAEATTGAAIAGVQAPDIGAITAEATTGAAIAGTQDSDVAALEVTAGTGSTDAAVAGTQAPDVGAITVEATLGLTLSATQASDVGYIVVEATLPASMAGTQDSDVAAITVTAAGTSIWTDISGSTTSWADQAAASTIWTDL